MPAAGLLATRSSSQLQEQGKHEERTGKGGDGVVIVWVGVIQEDQGHIALSSGPGDLEGLAGGDTGIGGIGKLELGLGQAGDTGDESETSELHFDGWDGIVSRSTWTSEHED